jgi:D-glycero-D-manno-heptose 1,7-bisphosphate phosphatase
MIKVAFLDRDGVINTDLGYVHSKEKFFFIDKAINAMRRLNALGYHIIIVTNQSGIGRGMFTEKQYKILTLWYKKFLETSGVFILDILYCPHFSSSKNPKYGINCNCRKPKPGMFNEAMNRYEINLSSSFVVGDKLSDLIAGSNAGLNQGFLIGDSHSENNKDFYELNCKSFKYRVVSDLHNCIKLLEKNESHY